MTRLTSSQNCCEDYIRDKMYIVQHSALGDVFNTRFVFFFKMQLFIIQSYMLPAHGRLHSWRSRPQSPSGNADLHRSPSAFTLNDICIYIWRVECDVLCTVGEDVNYYNQLENKEGNSTKMHPDREDCLLGYISKILPSSCHSHDSLSHPTLYRSD